MLVVNRLGKVIVKKVVLRKSRVEIHLDDETITDYYAAGAYEPDDELAVFSALMRNKFLDGRDRHEAQGSRTYKHSDTIHELQGEILDQAAYGACLYFELDRLRKQLRNNGIKVK